VPIPLGKGNGEVSDEFFAPMICAGYSAWCGLLRGEPKPGEVVAVVGVGGIGHLAVMMSVGVGGYRTIVVCSDEEKREWVKGLAPTVEVVKNGEELEEAGGADVLLACGSDNSKVEDAMQAMKPGGRVVLMGICFGDAVEGEEVGVEEKGPKGLVIHNLRFLFNGLQVRGSSHNGKEYLVQALKMVADGKVRPVVEVFGVEKIEKAVQRAMGGKAMGRVVVKWD
jgi:D-arabinose 1-dehydrogenase-like Zn-dependent alcohol dehydrogenase